MAAWRPKHVPARARRSASCCPLTESLRASHVIPRLARLAKAMRRRLALFVPLAVVLVAVAAAPAGADVFESTSSNWAGYAVSAADGATPLAYSNVSGAWKQPTATCTDGTQSYSAFWVGLGGLADGSQALEQVGTE